MVTLFVMVCSIPATATVGHPGLTWTGRLLSYHDETRNVSKHLYLVMLSSKE